MVMRWDEVAKAAIIALLSVSGGSYVTHSHDSAEQEKRVNENSMSCSEIIQLVVDSQGK
jgi:hypothetical protein